MTKVLVIDDTQDVRYAIKIGLESLGKGYEVLEAENADKAMQELPQMMPDIIVMDVMMPGTDGLDATIKIKNDPTLKDIPIIILTAKTDNMTKGVGQVAAEAFIEKPLDIETLDQTIDMIMLERKKTE